MQERLTADRANFAVAEQPRRRDRAERIGECLGVVIGHTEQRSPPAVAGAEQSAKHRLVRFQPGLVGLQLSSEVVVRGRCIAELELDRLSNTREGADGNGPGLSVEPQDVADEIVTPTVFVAVLVYRQPNEQVATRPLTSLLVQRVQRLAQHINCRPPTDRPQYV